MVECDDCGRDVDSDKARERGVCSECWKIREYHEDKHRCPECGTLHLPGKDVKRYEKENIEEVLEG